MKLDQKTAEAIIQLTRSAEFQVFMDWFDNAHQVFTQGAIMGIDEKFNADVLRGRAQGLAILKGEIEKAPEVVGRIQRVV